MDKFDRMAGIGHTEHDLIDSIGRDAGRIVAGERELVSVRANINMVAIAIDARS